jgi:glycine/D-amino acid oxidase-like deaminating enzyme
LRNVVVIGAGVVGASVGYALSILGAGVTILDAAFPAAGTTSNSFAWANANEKTPRSYFELNLAGLREHHRLSAELGGNGFHHSGNLEIASTAERRAYLRQKVERLRDWGYAAGLVDHAEAEALAPDLRLAEPDTTEYAFFPDEGWVAGTVLVAELLHEVRRNGGKTLFPRRASALDVWNGAVRGVIADGISIPADAVVDCAGPSAGDVLEPLGLRISRHRSPGLLVITNDVASTLDRIVHLDDVHLRPDGAGRYRLGTVDIDEQLLPDGSVSPEPGWPDDILRRAARTFPALGNARIEARRLGWRPMPGDRLSAVGSISGLAGYYVIFTHSGITLGPVLGKLVASELTTGQPRPELEPFRPDRLVERV